ncbi:MAG TPA: kelch repeat-containing protein, partial [Chitinophagaceae bacterium]
AGVTGWRIEGELPPLPGQDRSLGVAGPVTGVVLDFFVIGGGANFPDSMPWLGGKKKYYNEVYVLRKGENGTLQPYKVYQLPFPIAYAANVTLPGGIVSAGGDNEQGVSGKVLLLRWDSPADSLVISYLPDLPEPVTNASVTAIGNVVYLAGGETATGVSQRFYSLDTGIPNGGWETLPDLPKPVSHTVMVAQSDGDTPGIYLVGGRKRNAGSTSDLYSSVFRYDPRTKDWSPRRPLPYSLSAGTGMATGENGILLFGGDRGETFHKTESLIAAIAKETDEQRKKELNDQKIALQSGHPGFSQEVLRYNTKEDAWTVEGTLPFETPVTTTAVKWGSEVIIPSGEIRAGVRTSRILAGRLKH